MQRFALALRILGALTIVAGVAFVFFPAALVIAGGFALLAGNEVEQ